MSFYKMPPPWDPGYVIPDYVMSEPPMRGTITTAWLPRGTIPALIPDYLAVPQRSGGTLAKHSLAGGCFEQSSLSGTSLDGDVLGHIGSSQGPGGADVSAYGRKVARTLIAGAKRMPQPQRASALKKALASVDRTLPARAEKHAQAEMKRGTPAPQALERGIARAVSEGAMTEVHSLGRRARRVPQAGSSRGLGRSRMALGATLPSRDEKVPTSSSGPAFGNCTTDGVYIWAKAADGTGYWRRKGAGDTCTGTYDPTVVSSGGSGVTVTDSSGNVITTPVVAAPVLEQVPMVSVGPFLFPRDSTFSTYRWHAGAGHTPHYLPEDWQAEIRRLFTSSLAGSSAISTTGYQLDLFVSGLPAAVGNRFLFSATDAVASGGNQQLSSGNMPLFRAKHPVTGEDYGVFIGTGYTPSNVPINQADATLYIIWAKIKSPSWYESVWNFIKSIVVSVVDFAVDAVTAVKNATCALLTQPGADAAALTAAAKDPSLTTAGVTAGVMIGQQICGGAQPPPPAPASASGGSWLLPVAAVGGGVLLLYALTR